MQINIDDFIVTIINALQGLPPEIVTLISIMISGICILLSQRLFGLVGLYLYNALAIVLANIQVLRLCKYNILEDPVALGTVLFATLYLTTDIITEFYGAKAARRNVYLCFFATLLTAVLMIVDLGHVPAPCSHTAYHAMQTLFVPSARIFIASLCAFGISQFYDIGIFSFLKKLTQARFLWARTLCASLSSSFVDNMIFSVLAWSIFAQTPLNMHTIFMTYVLGAYIARALVGVLLIPVIYMCKRP
ncbi:MAG TPA: hypothetical protein DIC42_05190 [Holosporales bacterium]|nr:hypothetical protein [Holosporales bacterium]